MRGSGSDLRSGQRGFAGDSVQPAAWDRCLALCSGDGGSGIWPFTFGFSERSWREGNRCFLWCSDWTASYMEASGISDLLVFIVCGGDSYEIQYQKKYLCFSGIFGYVLLLSPTQGDPCRLPSAVGDRDT